MNDRFLINRGDAKIMGVAAGVADYTGIDPLFGSMADFDALLTAAHDDGLKLILDLVPNHTQWLCFEPERSSSSAVSITPHWASTKRWRLNVSDWLTPA